jgi:adenylate cyclase
MESHGKENIIQITRSPYELIGEKFKCEAQGSIHVKGKGEMEVWHVTSLVE